jgi:hypothetical protein
MISAASGKRFAEDLDCFIDPIKAIVEDLERIRAYPHLPSRDKVRGFMYDLAANQMMEA